MPSQKIGGRKRPIGINPLQKHSLIEHMPFNKSSSKLDDGRESRQAHEDGQSILEWTRKKSNNAPLFFYRFARPSTSAQMILTLQANAGMHDRAIRRQRPQVDFGSKEEIQIDSYYGQVKENSRSTEPLTRRVIASRIHSYSSRSIDLTLIACTRCSSSHGEVVQMVPHRGWVKSIAKYRLILRERA